MEISKKITKAVAMTAGNKPERCNSNWCPGELGTQYLAGVNHDYDLYGVWDPVQEEVVILGDGYGGMYNLLQDFIFEDLKGKRHYPYTKEGYAVFLEKGRPGDWCHDTTGYTGDPCTKETKKLRYGYEVITMLVHGGGGYSPSDIELISRVRDIDRARRGE